MSLQPRSYEWRFRLLNGGEVAVTCRLSLKMLKIVRMLLTSFGMLCFWPECIPVLILNNPAFVGGKHFIEMIKSSTEEATEKFAGKGLTCELRLK